MCARANQAMPAVADINAVAPIQTLYYIYQLLE